MTQYGFSGFLGFLSSFGAQNECVGARVLFGTQKYVYIGPRAAFR